MAAIAFCGWLCLLPDAVGEPVALRGATVIDVVAGKAVPNAVIVVDGDRITAFGGDRTAVPAGAKVIDLKGKYIIPGLVDGHTHYLPFLGELYLNHGVTSVLNIAGANRDPSGGEPYRRASMRSDFRAPRVFGTGSVPLSTRQGPKTIEDARAAVDAFMKGNPDFAFFGDYKDPYKNEWALLTKALHEQGIAVYGHTSNAAESSRFGHDVIEHMWGFALALMTPEEFENYRRGRYLHWSSFFKNESQVDRLIEDAVRNGSALNPTLIYTFVALSTRAAQYEILTNSLYTDEALMTYYPQNLAAGLVKGMRSIPVSSLKYGPSVALSRITPTDLAELEADYKLLQMVLRKWAKAGGKIVGGIDDPFIGTSGLSAHLEMAMMVEAGLQPMEALRAMTLSPAEVTTMRRTGSNTPSFGFIGEGAYADLVVLGADPLKDIDNTRHIEQVMKGGSFVRLGYTPTYWQGPPLSLSAKPDRFVPEISAITPHTVEEGSGSFEIVVDGNGFQPDSVVQVDGVILPTVFVSSRKLRAQAPASIAAAGQSNRFTLPGLDQRPAVFGDHSARVTVFTQEPDGGTSNAILLRVQEPWLFQEAHTRDQ
ncbi:MAG TPA: amidohydrolase family protein [Hyphomonadaceae bacterium]|nr:amidohydrolase family protein [Hyphomonadaceae bacterium]